MAQRTREQILAARRAVRETFGGDLWDSVSTLLYEDDPIGLARLGAPGDEYEPEVETILPRLSTCESAEDAQRTIFEEFERWFGVGQAGSREGYRGVAERIWQVWSERRSDA